MFAAGAAVRRRRCPARVCSSSGSAIAPCGAPTGRIPTTHHVPDDGVLVDLIAEIAPSERCAAGAAGRQSAAALSISRLRWRRVVANAAIGRRPFDVSGRLEGKVAIVTGAGSRRPRLGQRPRDARSASRRRGPRSSRSTATSRRLEETLATRARTIGGTIEPFMLRRDRQQRGRGDGRRLHRHAGAASTCWSTTSAARPPGGPVEMSEDVWDAQVDLNLKSVFLACKHVLPLMERRAAARSSTSRRPPACAGPARRRSRTRRPRPA